MMTSAPSYSATATALSSSGSLGDPAGSSGGEQPEQLSLRLVKRPLVGGHPLQEACKKRRKQSTPIRISTTEPSGGGGGVQSTSEPSSSGDSGVPEPCGGGGSSSGACSPPEPAFLSASPTGPDTRHTPEQQQQPDGGAAEAAGGVVGPPLLPAWMSEHMQQALGKPPADQQADWLPLQGLPAPLYFSQLSQPELPGQPRAPSTQPAIRIFNPEAYCELCNKEFCNKYFLKTHKANKHRIYTDPPVSEMLMNIPNFSAPAPVPPHLKKNNMASADVVKNNEPGQNKPLPTYNCDLCGKLFSYKILLKNHKKNVHGIPFEPDAATDFETEQMERKLLKLDDPEPGQLEPPPADEESLHKANTLFKNGTPVDISLVKEETCTEQDDSSYNVINSSKMSPVSVGGQPRDNQTDQATNRLRRIGIMNPEAFCEICCKEYCNKYFLRTHKMKRHGIIIPDDGVKDNIQKHESSFINNWYQIQTSPLNLIMGEQNTNSSGSCGEGKLGSLNENECDACGMRFQTAYLAQLHASLNCKGKQLTDIHELGIKTENANINNNANNDEKNPPAVSADAISEDLQKLQSMILQLNNLGDKKVGGPPNVLATCHFCKKEFENKYILQSHLISEHNIFPEENFEDKRDRESDVSSTDKLICKVCGREGFISIDSFKQHKTECQNSASMENKEDSTDLGNADSKLINSERKFPAQITVERRSSVSLTPTSSYCEICNKELCNKYFMKTHMQRMHGIEIENGAQIGGVVCNICNKELCSKYFLRVHKHNTHGIVEDGSTSVTGQPKQIGNDMENSVTQSQQNELIDNTLKPDLADLSHRYFSHFSEVCSICSRRFRSTKWLKAHLLGDHGKLGSDKWNELELQLQQSFGQTNRAIGGSKGNDRISSPMLKIPNGNNAGNGDKDRIQSVQNVLSSLFGTDESNVKQYFCSYCSFSTPVLAFLFVHERSHSRSEQDGVGGSGGGGGGDQAGLQCVVCSQVFRQRELLQHHILSQHPFLQMGAAPFLQQQPSPEQQAAGANKSLGADGGQCGSPEPAGARDDRACTRCKNDGGVGAGGPNFSLQDLSKQSNMPATYALPQSVPASKYVMQAFLLDEPAAPAAEAADEESPPNDHHQQQQQSPPSTPTTEHRKFAPSIVFLPVLERLNAPLTVCFTLTPT